MALFEGFERRRVATSGAEINLVTGGSGPPLLLLHGNPQSHVMWHKMAPALAERYTVVAADLRGYGDSSKPPAGEGHIAYSKREMARDMAEVMSALGHERFFLAGHDRGGRVSHRLALDWPDRVLKVCVLDIGPTREMYHGTTMAFATHYWHWFFMIQPPPFPETLMGADPDFFWLTKCGRGSAGLTPFTEEALAEYLRCFRDPEMHRGSCEDYRAAASIDIAIDDADGDKRVACPLLALWAANGAVEKNFDTLALWRKRADQVEGEALPAGHYLVEEIPDMVRERLEAFFV